MISRDIDSSRLPEEQSSAAITLMEQVESRIKELSSQQRHIYTKIWGVLARATAPVVAQQLNADTPYSVKIALETLVEKKLVWFDDDLKAVLQCPPFSALHTAHEVKAFGWNRAYTCSVIDASLALLFYGPNTGLTVTSQCPRSGEKLQFRVTLNSEDQLKLEAPPESSNWCVWIPQPMVDNLEVGPRSQRSMINMFHSRADLDTYQHYHSENPAGAIYTLPQAIYLSEQLFKSYNSAFD